MASRKRKKIVEIAADGSWTVNIDLDWRKIGKPKPERREKSFPKDPPPPPEDPKQLRLFGEESKGGEV